MGKDGAGGPYGSGFSSKTVFGDMAEAFNKMGMGNHSSNFTSTTTTRYSSLGKFLVAGKQNCHTWLRADDVRNIEQQSEKQFRIEFFVGNGVTIEATAKDMDDFFFGKKESSS